MLISPDNTDLTLHTHGNYGCKYKTTRRQHYVDIDLCSLAYAHMNGIVLLDIIQKCVIMNATLSDLYGGSASINPSAKDIGILPFATSSILQHHYQSQQSTVASLTGDLVSAGGGGSTKGKQQAANNGSGAFNNGSTDSDAVAQQKSGSTNIGSPLSQQVSYHFSIINNATSCNIPFPRKIHCAALLCPTQVYIHPPLTYA